MKLPSGKNDVVKEDSPDKVRPQATPRLLENVIAQELTGSIFELQTGLFNHGLNLARQSGATTARDEDTKALTEHARAMARALSRDRYDPKKNPHDAMHRTEYERALAQRVEAEKGEQYSAANLREAEDKLALTPKAGPKPTAHPLLVPAFVTVITLTVAPTLHDSIFGNLGDDLLAWFAASVSAAFVGAMLTLAILNARRTAWSWIGCGAGVLLGVGLAAIRLASARGAHDVTLALGLTALEISAVILLEWSANSLQHKEAEWTTRNEAETKAIAYRDTAQGDLSRWQTRIKRSSDEISAKIAFVEDRHNRVIHVAELEELAIKAELDGYNAGIAENIGRVLGVPRGRP
jgi:hypothetical protein